MKTRIRWLGNQKFHDLRGPGSHWFQRQFKSNEFEFHRTGNSHLETYLKIAPFIFITNTIFIVRLLKFALKSPHDKSAIFHHGCSTSYQNILQPWWKIMYQEKNKNGKSKMKDFYICRVLSTWKIQDHQQLDHQNT